MKLALCLQYPIGLRGGVSVLVEELALELAKQGCEIVLVSPDTPETLDRSPLSKKLAKHISWDRIEETAATAKELARQIAAAKVDVAHFHAGGNFGWTNRYFWRCPISYLDRMGVPCLFTSHSAMTLLDGYCGRFKPVWFKLAMLPLAWSGKISQLRHVQREIAVSQDNLRKLQRWYFPLRNRFVQIYHSRLPGRHPAPGGLERKRVVLYVGHIAKHKGQLWLAQAFADIAARYPDWVLQLAGHDGGDGIVEQIHDLQKSHGLAERIQLLGERNDTMELMQQAAIYVQPSYSEALGLALQEAMYYGCPTIGSRVGGIPELVQEGQTGLLVEPGNVGQLGVALEKLMQDGSLRQRYGVAGAAAILARGMTGGKMAQTHLALYESIARKA